MASLFLPLDLIPPFSEFCCRALGCHAGLLSPGEAGEASTQLGDRPFFFKEDKEAAENLVFFLHPHLPPCTFCLNVAWAGGGGDAPWDRDI